MKTMIVSDFIQIKRSLPTTLAICVIVCVVIAFGTGSSITGAAALAAMIPYMMIYTLLANDEVSGWCKMLATLPLTKRDIVLGRYASTLLIAIAAFVISVICSFVVGWLFSLIPGAALPSQSPFAAGTISETLIAGALGAGASLVLASITLPIVMRFGLTRTARILPLLFVMAFVVSMAFLRTDDPSAGMPSVAIEQIGIVVLAASALLFVISAAITCKLYEAREF